MQGTGRDGRILKEDMIRHIESMQKVEEPIQPVVVQARQPVCEPTQPKVKPEPSSPPKATRAPTPVGQDRVEPIKGFKKAMVKTMTSALVSIDITKSNEAKFKITDLTFQRIPHFGYSDEIDMTAMVALRHSLKGSSMLKERGVKLSYMPFFIKAASMALTQFPVLNASVDEACENITYK